MNATQPLKILMPRRRRRDDSEKPHSVGNLFTPSEKEKGINYTLAFDNRHAFRDVSVVKSSGFPACLRERKHGTRYQRRCFFPTPAAKRLSDSQ